MVVVNVGIDCMMRKIVIVVSVIMIIEFVVIVVLEN